MIVRSSDGGQRGVYIRWNGMVEWNSGMYYWNGGILHRTYLIIQHVLYSELYAVFFECTAGWMVS